MEQIQTLKVVAGLVAIVIVSLNAWLLWQTVWGWIYHSP